jgi:tetratricopeptide (TPR) repeat protein
MDENLEIDALTKLAIRHGTNKWGLSFYTPIYHALFGHLRERPVRLLEIGVGGYGFRRIGGASLAMWADYFMKGTVVGIDIAEKDLDLGPRVTLLRGAQEDAQFLAKVAADHGPFDIVIDDGSHVSQHIVASFGQLFPVLAENGFYVIEDIQCAFTPQYGGVPIIGGGTLQLAHTILQALNYAEIQAFSPDWQAPAFAPTIRSFRAYHNLFIVEKGDNREPPNLRYDPDNAHVKNVIASFERELAHSPSPDGNAFLAHLYSITGRERLALELIETSLTQWPDQMKLLVWGARIAALTGKRGIQLRYLARAAELDPSDSRVQQMLAEANGGNG